MGAVPFGGLGAGLDAAARGFRTLLLEQEDMAVIWRGPLVSGAIKQFWGDIFWGTLDYLIVDLPPGTSDASLTVMQSLPMSGIVLVSSPQGLAGMVVRKAAWMAQQMQTPILGLIENMSYFLCPHCDGRSEIFGHGGAAETCRQMGLRFLGEIPLQTTLREASDAGVPIVTRAPDSPASVALARTASEAAAALAVLESL